VAEAEALAWGGIPDILVTNQVVSPRKLARLAALARIAEVSVCVDDAAQIVLIEAAAEAAGVRLPVLVEIDVGMARGGVEHGPPAVALAERIAASRHLRFGGLQAYHGSAQHKRAPEERAAAIGEAVARSRRTVEQLRQRGLECPIVGGAGTGTFRHEAASGVYTEIQAGSYCFMDADYAANEDAPPFRQSLFVLSQIMSTAGPGIAVLDCGHKGVSVDSGMPQVWQRPGLRYAGASDEHGKIVIEDGRAPKLGEKLRLVPGHCDPTVDRYDWYVGVRMGAWNAFGRCLRAVGWRNPIPHHPHTSRLATFKALPTIKSRRGSTRSPIRVEKTCSASSTSSTRTRSSVRIAGSSVVFQS
jgi:3-hydroxy-D-aspartate aldolase